MKIEQLYTKCLAHAAYYIESEGEAVIIDPLRETDQYVEEAQKLVQKLNTFSKLISMPILFRDIWI